MSATPLYNLFWHCQRHLLFLQTFLQTHFRSSLLKPSLTSVAVCMLVVAVVPRAFAVARLERIFCLPALTKLDVLTASASTTLPTGDAMTELGQTQHHRRTDQHGNANFQLAISSQRVFSSRPFFGQSSHCSYISSGIKFRRRSFNAKSPTGCIVAFVTKAPRI